MARRQPLIPVNYTRHAIVGGTVGAVSRPRMTAMTDSTDTLLNATTALIPPLLSALHALEQAGRYLNPPDVPALAAGLAEYRGPVAAGLEEFAALDWPDHLALYRHQAEAAAAQTLEALDGMTACQSRSEPVFGAYRALGAATRALEALYPVAFMLPPVNRFYLDPDRRDDEALQSRLLAADPHRPDAGVMHADNGSDQRGGFSVYVPEDYDGSRQLPLVVALHGGSGHGRWFLWTWLRSARSRGAIVLAPTSVEGTWGLTTPERDAANLAAMVEQVSSLWQVDPARVLLTGMSDGGTFAWLAGLRDDVPYTHLAPVSATFHPLLLEGAGAARLRGLPVYLVHGALDWMFPVETARLARDALTAAGADVTYRELADLSHTYPREENPQILDWLSG